MNQYLTRSLNVVGHCCEVITFRVPYQFANNMLEFHLNTFSSLNASIFNKVPADELLFLVISKLIKVICTNPLFHLLASFLGEGFAIELGLEDVDEFFVGYGEEASLFAGAPFNAINNSVFNFVFSNDSGCLCLPNYNVMVFVSGGKVSTAW